MSERKNSIGEAVEEAAVKKLGVSRWDRAAIYRDAAESAVENRLPFWAVLILSGGIATLGLALNSSAVVIGAMLVAPLLAPVMGLALALGAGDSRLAVQSGAVVLGSTAAVIVTGAVLTAVLPFQTITLEITSRSRPSTLDLVIAIFSGLVGAVVMVARGSRLSAAIPGVAISVALIPPLAVAGFGTAASWNSDLIYGSMLLYGANLAGIVLSGMGVFLLVGMHRPDVVEAALQWHREGQTHGLAAIADRIAWVRRLGMLRSPWARTGLVMVFVVALAIPLRETLAQIAREARVQRAASLAEAQFERAGRTSIMSQEIVYGNEASVVHLRIATTRWVDEDAREQFERAASVSAGEPVRLVLEQLPASDGNIEGFAQLLTTEAPANLSPGPQSLSGLLSLLRSRLEETAGGLVLPDSVWIGGLELANTQFGRVNLRAAYVSAQPLPREAEEMLARQLTQALDIPELSVRLTHVSTQPRPIGEPADTARLREVADLLLENGGLRAELLAPAAADSASLTPTIDYLVRLGVERQRISIRVDPPPESGLRVRVRAARPEQGGSAEGGEELAPADDIGS